jgi:poly(3-hydroxybutyrate) depolymerase
MHQPIVAVPLMARSPGRRPALAGCAAPRLAGLVLLLIASLGAAAAPLGASDATVTDFLPFTYPGSGTTPAMPYRLFVPVGYNAAAATTYPLVVFLNGSGGNGSDNVSQINDQPGCLVFVNAANQVAHPCFMLAPQDAAGAQWVNTNPNATDPSYVLASVPISPQMQQAEGIIGVVRASYNIDASRIYVTGLSLGGFGTWDIAYRNPTLFAAAVPMSGAGAPTSSSLIADLPVWCFHGLNDTTVPPLGDEETIAALKVAGGTPIFTEDSNGHGGWTGWYDTPASGGRPSLVDWVFSQSLASGLTTLAPVITPAGGDFALPPTVTLAAPAVDAYIRYTTDGSTPSSANGTIYSAPFALSANATVNAIAYQSGAAASAVVGAAFAIGAPAGAVATPVIAPAAGPYAAPQTVSISDATAGAVIRYTTDGSTPGPGSPVYGGTLLIASTTTVNAYATLSGVPDSAIAAALYTITTAGPPPATPAAPTVANPGATPTLSGTAPAGYQLLIIDNGSEIAVLTVPAGGSWSWTPTAPLGSGAHSFTVVVVDGSGNASLPSAATAVTVGAPAGAASTSSSASHCGLGSALAAVMMGGALALRRRGRRG